MAGDRDRSAEASLARIAEAQAMLAEVSRSLGPTLALEGTLKSVLQAMRELVSFRGGSIALAEGGYVRIAAADPRVSDDVLALRLPVGQGIVGRVVVEAQTIYSPDIRVDDRVDKAVRETGSNNGIVSYLAVPLICLGKPIGVLQVDNEQADAFDDVDIMLLEGLAAQTATAIESARQFEERSRLDGLKHGFINLVSHELRTPLTIASGMVQAVAGSVESVDADSVALLGRATVALERLGRLIEELIMMSQLSAGAIRPRRHDVKIRSVVDSVLAKLEDPTLVRTDGVQDVIVRTDERLLEVILSALVENAVTYAGNAELCCSGSTIVVSDHGPGLPDDVLVEGTETFSRSRSNATTIAGLGLGLSMATALTTELGGELRITSTPGEGTTIEVDLSTP